MLHVSDHQSSYISQENFLHLAALIPEAVYTTDQNGVITFYNKKAEDLWGRSPKLNDPEEIPFCGSWKLLKPDGTAMAHKDCPMGRALKYKMSFRKEEIWIERSDGKKINAFVNIDPVFNQEGELCGAINIFQNAAEYKSSYEDSVRLAAIVESSDDAIISKTLNGIITSWNKGAERIFGYQDHEIIGKPINILIPSSLQDEERSIIEKIRKGEKIEHFETTRVNKFGEELNISLTVSPIKNENGIIIGASKISRDITEKIKAEKQLKIYTEKLKELNSYKDDFMAMASHELKTPLTVIKANVELLQLKIKDNHSKDFVDRTMLQINKLSALIADLLDISKVQAGSLELNLATFDAGNLIAETIENIQQTTHTHIIIFEPPQEPLFINGDWARLEQVIVNVLTNAVKYSPASDKILVSAAHISNNIIIKVRDFGIGIPKQDIKKVFSRFFRVKGSSSAFLGSGIGLYISNEIIKRHKGKMWAESEESEGSEFYISIPANEMPVN